MWGKEWSQIVRKSGSGNVYLVRHRGLSLRRNERSDHPSCLVNSAMTTSEVRHQNMQVDQSINTRSAHMWDTSNSASVATPESPTASSAHESSLIPILKGKPIYAINNTPT